MLCACGSQKEYAGCCELHIEGKFPAPTAEALMRSRYTAYTMARIPYLRDTLAPEKRQEFDEQNARQWALEATWRGLRIIAAKEEADTATVEFIASYAMKGKIREHHEIASFRRDHAANCWFFIDGHDPQPEESSRPVVTFVRAQPKVGRNEPCPCKSGKKFKQCCGK